MMNILQRCIESMKIKFECSYCKRQFDNECDCYDHELSEHVSNEDKIKYCIINILHEDICSYCQNLYYVYNCEPNCSHKDCTCKNNYKNFKWNGGGVDYDF